MDGVFQEIEYRLILDRDDLRALGAVIATEAGFPQLVSAIRWYLLPTVLIDWGLRGHPRPRRHAQAHHDLWVVIRCAVIAARELVVSAEKNEHRDLKVRLTRVIEDDRYMQMLFSDIGDEGPKMASAAQHRLVMALTDRALRPALNRFDVKPFLNREISAVLDHRESRVLAEMFVNHPQWLSWWFDLLLAPVEGEAARALKLI